MIDDENEAAGRQADRLRLRRHAEPHALRDRQGLRRGRLQRHLRQAADVRPRPRPRSWPRSSRRPASSSPSRTTTPATRWCARPARWSWPASWARSTPSASFYIQGWLRTRLESERPEAGRLADRSRASAARPAASATSARTPTTSAATSPACCPTRSRCHLKIVRAGPAARRLRHGRHPLRERRPGHRHRLADHPRPRERPVHRDRRHQGRARVAPGGAEQDDRPHATASRTRSTPATRRPVPERRRQGRLPRCPAATPRRSSRRSPTSTLRPTTTWSSGPTGKKFETVEHDLPNVDDGVEGMNFITQCVASSQEDGAWKPLAHKRARK